MGNRERRTIRYFGYGANASAEMMKAIIGRKPSGIVAQLKNYELQIQSWREIPPKVRKLLRKQWKSEFRTYCVNPRQGEKVNGRVWLVTPKERRLISKWEFWYRPITVKVRVQSGKLVTAETEMVRKPATRKKRINGKRYRFFLNSKRRMLEIAEKVRG